MSLKYSLSYKQALAYKALENEGRQYLLYGGSAGGGKSILGCFWQISQRLKYPQSHGLILRQTRKDIYSTVMVSFHKVAEKLFEGMPMPYKVNENKDEIQFSNGSIIYLREARYMPQDPQYDRLKLEVMDAWIEEGTQVDERAYIAIRPRIREVHGGAQAKLLITSNPGQGWLKNTFIKSKDGVEVQLKPPYSYIQAKVFDNPDEQFAINYANSLSELDPITRSMYLDGNWDVNINENPFFYAFNREKHVALENVEIRANDRWVLSFDFNQNPCTLIVAFADLKMTQVATIDHITANQFTMQGSSPLEATCRLFYKRYIETGLCMPQFIIVTGDASGRQGSADRVAQKDFYDTIVRELEISVGQVKVPKANPTHIFSRELCNYVLNRMPKDALVVSEHCPTLITEIQSSYPDDNGTLNEAKKKLGLHGVDAWRYLLHYLFNFGKYKETVMIYEQRAKRKDKAV